MTIVGKFQIDNPDKMSATMEITMTVGEWRQVRQDLRKPTTTTFYSATESLVKVIGDLITKAESTYHAREET